MESPYFKQIIDAIKTNTAYSTNVKIAQRIGIEETTLRRYWSDPVRPNQIPDRQIDAFVGFLQEIACHPLSTQEAKTILQSPQSAILQHIIPNIGPFWAGLLGQALEKDPLHFFARPSKRMGFGELDLPSPKNVDRVSKGQKFYIEAHIPWPSEVVLFCEHLDEFKFMHLRPQQRLVSFESGPVTLPPENDGQSLYFVEQTKPGLYRYHLVAQRGAFSPRLRTQFAQVNTLNQASLDSLAGQLLDVKGANIHIQSGRLFVDDGSP